MTDESRVFAIGGAFISSILAVAYLGPWRWQWTLRRRFEIPRHGLHGLPTRRDLLQVAGRLTAGAAALFGLAIGVGLASDAWIKGRGHPELEWSAEAVLLTAGLLGAIAAFFAALMLVGQLLWHRRRVVPTRVTVESLARYLDAVSRGDVPYDQWRDWNVVRYHHPDVEAVRREAATILTGRPRELGDEDLARLQHCAKRLRACRLTYAAADGR